MNETTTPVAEDLAQEPELEQPVEEAAEEAPDPIAEGQRLLEALAKNEAERAEACWKEMVAVLNKYGMKLHIPQPQLNIVPNT